MKNSLHFEEFNSVNFDDWQTIAKDQLKGKNPLDVLSWKSMFDTQLSCYYDQGATQNLDYLYHFFSLLTPYKWQQLETILVGDETEAVNRAEKALEKGCEGILYKIFSAKNLDVLTQNDLHKKGILSFCVNDNTFDQIKNYTKRQNSEGFILNLSNPSQNVTDCTPDNVILKTAEMLHHFSQNPSEKPVIYLNLMQDFFHEMARIRGTRYLIWRVGSILYPTFSPHVIHIHSEPQHYDEKEENWFSQIAIGLASLLGGVNSLSFNGEENNDTFRNIGNILKYESKIKKIKNVATGSYFIDYLTDAFIQKVWTQFQELS